MNSPESTQEATSSGLFPIRTVSNLTGVNPITLRAWENRHGLIQPIRKESGHRLYTQEHIDLINRVVGLLDRGMRIGQVREFLESNQAQTTDPEQGPAVADGWRRYLDGMIAGVIRFDQDALESVYQEALSHHPVSEVTANLIQPLLVELGRRWEAGLGSIAEEHFFGFYLRNKLGARFHHLPRRNTGPILLLACMPGDRHEIGLLRFALEASERGYRPIMLGPDMPLDELPAAAKKTGADAIILSGMFKLHSQKAASELAQMVSETTVPVLVGGQVSVLSFDPLVKAGAEPLGSDLEAGMRRLEEVAPL